MRVDGREGVDAGVGVGVAWRWGAGEGFPPKWLHSSQF